MLATLVATLAATLVTAGTSAVAHAQTPAPARGAMASHQDGMAGMKGMHGGNDMKGTMGGPHHALAMAYRENLVTFTKALRRYGVLKESIKLSDYRGKTVVLAFFFKARTKG